MIARICERFGIGGRVREAALAAYKRCSVLEYPAQRQAQINVLEAFLAEGIAESDFAGTTGYGYDDAARERYEALLGRVLGAQRAVARLSIVSGTHAIVAALAACTPPSR
ncbi:MAG: methionine gamma-lyase family protein, partial [Candidatus Cybelea sp.]